MYLIEDGNEFHLESSIIPLGISAIATLFWSLGGWGGCVWASGKMLGAWEQARVFLRPLPAGEGPPGLAKTSTPRR